MNALKKENISSFPTFKESETALNEQIEYYQVLLGYSKFDFEKFQDNVRIDKKMKVLLFGVHSLALNQILMNEYDSKLYYFNEPKLPNTLLEDYNIEILNPTASWQILDYDLVIFSRFFQNWPSVTQRAKSEMHPLYPLYLCTFELCIFLIFACPKIVIISLKPHRHNYYSSYFSFMLFKYL